MLDATDNEALAKAVNWFVDWPLRIVFVLLGAWVATRLCRRWVRRVVVHFVSAPPNPTQHLQRIGIDLTKQLGGAAPEDPRRESRAHSISAVLTNTAVALIWAIAILMVIDIVGINLGPLLAGAGIAGIALGFGAQTLVRDCIAGLFMLLEDQFGIGDVVDVGEASGTVEEVSLRVTVLRGADGTRWHVPNGEIRRVGNQSQLWSMAIVDIVVSPDSDISQVRDVMQQAAEHVCADSELGAQILEPPTVLGVESVTADGITARVTVKVEPGRQWAVQRALRAHIKAALDEAGISIPYAARVPWPHYPQEPAGLGHPVEHPDPAGPDDVPADGEALGDEGAGDAGTVGDPPGDRR